MTKSNAERQEALRKRKRDAGLKEVRGIYATEAEEREIKKFAAEIAKSRRIGRLVRE